MHVAMERDERILFESFVNCSDRYLEFGSGGSTWLAASKKKEWIVSVDSSSEWLDAVALETKECPTPPKLLMANIGAIKEWGFPATEETKELWPLYHEEVWKKAQVSDADLFFIDGRFRVACVLQCVIRGSDRAIFGVHDFERECYHVILRFVRPISTAGRLSFFLKVNDFDHDAAAALLEKFKFDPA